MEMDKVSNLDFPLTHIDEPGVQEIERDPPLIVEKDDRVNEKLPRSMESGETDKKTKSNKPSEVLKTYPKRVSRNKQRSPNYYGWSSYNLLKWI